MFNSTALEVVIGLVFLYWLVSVMCSTLNEMVSWIFSLRAKTLEEGLRSLLGDGPEAEELRKALYEHPLIGALETRLGRPTFLSARVFSAALLDHLCPMDPAAPNALETLNASIDKLKTERLKGALQCLLRNAQGDLTRARASLEAFYDERMARVSGWYKHKSQVIILAWAVVLTAALNADTVMIANILSRNGVVREAIVAQAAERTRRGETNPAPATGNERIAQVRALNADVQSIQVLGWEGSDASSPNAMPSGFWGWVSKLLGLSLTIVAAMLGAPFWFDLLSKFVNLRSTGDKPRPAVGTK